MFVGIRDARRSPADRRYIESSYERYLDDLMRVSMNTGVFPAYGRGEDDSGDRQPEMMARWFVDDFSYPLAILHDNAPVGFALVSRPVLKNAQLDYRLAEFYVERELRRRGLGREAAELIFNRFDGRWEVVELLRNQAAVKFWRAVVEGYTRGQYSESTANGEMRLLFQSDPNRGRLRGVG